MICWMSFCVWFSVDSFILKLVFFTQLHLRKGRTLFISLQTDERKQRDVFKFHNQLWDKWLVAFTTLTFKCQDVWCRNRGDKGTSGVWGHGDTCYMLHHGHEGGGSPWQPSSRGAGEKDLLCPMLSLVMWLDLSTSTHPFFSISSIFFFFFKQQKTDAQQKQLKRNPKVCQHTTYCSGLRNIAWSFVCLRYIKNDKAVTKYRFFFFFYINLNCSK